MNNYDILITAEILKDSILGTQPVLGRYLKILDFIPHYIWYLSDITNCDIWDDILSVKSQGYGIQTCTIQISIQIRISCPYLDMMLGG